MTTRTSGFRPASVTWPAISNHPATGIALTGGLFMMISATPFPVSSVRTMGTGSDELKGSSPLRSQGCWLLTDTISPVMYEE